jgi:PIN domain nuclease of toxin-antitoxin system
VTVAPLLDTHAWIWWLHGDPRLGRPALRKLDQFPQNVRPAISDISLWEVATLVSLGRLELQSTLDAWLAIAAHPSTVRVLPITTRIAAEVARLPDSFHRDPADRLIVSTSRVHGLPVLTRDAAIVKSGLVRLWSPGAAQAPFRDGLPRIYELKDMLEDPAHPNAYFKDFEKSLKKNPSTLDAFLKLERQVAALDTHAWDDLKQKAAPHLISRERHRGRGWRELFDALNEAKAFTYLETLGCTGVHFLERTQHQTADLGGILDGSRVLCEVKTINQSDNEADKRLRVNQGEVITSKVSTRVTEGFLRKLRSTIESAVEQLDAEDPQRRAHRIVFIVVNFDDSIGEYQDRYFQQIDEHLENTPIDGATLVFCPAANYFGRNITMQSAAVFLE